MLLFDEFERVDTDPMHETETDYHYLNRSARAISVRVREELEEWFSRYPPEEQAELRSRFEFDDDRSAFFELAVHELLQRLGLKVDIHEAPGEATGRRPDFTVHSPKCQSFYLEAVLATGESEEDVAARTRENCVYELLNEMESPDFFLTLHVREATQQQPSARRMRQAIGQWLDGLHPDEVIAHGPPPGLTYCRDGWVVEFHAIPKLPQFRGQAGVRPIGVRIGGLAKLGCEDAIRTAVKRKSSRYGKLDRPYVIAVNALSEDVTKEEIVAALVGSPKAQIVQNADGELVVEPTGRAANGAWTGGESPTGTRVSAVLVAIQASPWNVGRVRAKLYHNPNAQRPYECELTRLPQARFVGDEAECLEGESLGEVLGLAEAWPAEG
ncbi:MAG: hypothetical protein ACE149_14410 [Armatimonadota bacterium]